MKALLWVFGRTGRRRVAVLAVAMVFAGLLEAVSVAMVFPFIQLTLNPVGEEAEFARKVLGVIGMSGASSPVRVIGWLTLLLFLSATALSAGTAWFMLRMAASENRKLSIRLLSGYVHQPYAFFLERNTSTLGKNLLSEVDMLADNVLVPLGYLVGRVALVVCIVGFLVYANPLVAMSMVGVVGMMYGLLYLVIRDPMGRRGRRRTIANTDRFRAASEALGGIKEIKVLGREPFFIESFAAAARAYSRVIAQGQIAGTVPKYFLEAVGIGGILGLLLAFAHDDRANTEIVPMLALYAAAAYRVMPGLQQIYTGIANLRFNTDRIWLLKGELEILEVPNPERDTGQGEDIVRFHSAVTLDRVSFRYADAGVATLNELSMTIPRNSCIAIVGETGSGKTTLVDLLLGLHRPQAGAFQVDGVALRPEQLRAWRKNVGYVPQTIYLSDSSIRSNIAFGIREAEIDDAAVQRAAELAGVHRFITEQTPHGYDTIVGDRGVRLSGGQRQRIGIARALYGEPDMVILDEATSSLDYRTEEGVMRAIRALSADRTVIMVAHRLITIQDCDRVFVVEQGRVREEGTYQELIRSGGSLAAIAATYSESASPGKSG